MANFLISSFADEASSIFSEQLSIMRNNDIAYLEMRAVDGKNIVDHSLENVHGYAAQLKEHGVGLSAVGTWFGKISVNDDFNPHLERFKRAVECAQILGANAIRMFSFYIPEGMSHAQCRDVVMERLERFVEVCPPDVACYHENEKGIYGDDAEHCLDIYKSFKGKIKGIFDPANFIQCGVDTLEAYDILEDYIHYFHIKDAFMSTWSVVPAGEGDGKIPQLISRVSKKSGDFFLSVEPHLQISEGIESLEDYIYSSKEQAYTTAVSALKSVLSGLGYNQTAHGEEKRWIRVSE